MVCRLFPPRHKRPPYLRLVELMEYSFAIPLVLAAVRLDNRKLAYMCVFGFPLPSRCPTMCNSMCRMCNLEVEYTNGLGPDEPVDPWSNN